MSQRPSRRLFHRNPFPRDLSHAALLVLLALVALWLQGCAQTKPLAAPPPWPLDDPAPVYEVEPQRPPAGPDAGLTGAATAGLGGETAPPAPSTERLIALALQEWELWGGGRWDATTHLTERRLDIPRRQETEPYLHARVLLYWIGVKGPDYPLQRTRFDDGSLKPWSAVFISWLMRNAGFGDRQFEASELHWHYIRAALDGSRPGLEARDAAVTPPRAGDLICAPRDAQPDAPATFAQWTALPRAQRTRIWTWHCDLVVQVDGLELGAIGGNISESVSWTRAPLDAGGRLVPTPDRAWTVLLRQKGVPP
ncbi:DUF2272 domain-containing protein [Roseateles chitinivorans]|uniref:DUF2272 domain-containing protein n=1 Tax=Roseateles chitinivorans TaxID=2917965 RepID=UPI003D6750F4